MPSRMPRILAIILSVSVLAACSIQRDVPDFQHPDPKIDADTPPPQLQPTQQLQTATAQDSDGYSDTIAELDARKYDLLRRASALTAPPQ